MPLVSVIIPAFNAQLYIGAAIQSVLDQTFRDLELIIIDDGSTDGTSSIAKKFAKEDSRINYHWQRNSKLARARNAGLAVAFGRLVAFLDADDVWVPEKLEKQINAFQQHNVDVVFSDAFHIPESTKSLPSAIFGGVFGLLAGPEMFRLLYRDNPIPVSSVVIRLTEQQQGDCRFSESEDIRGVEDYEFWLRLSSHGATFFGLCEKLIGYRSHPSQMSRQKVSMMMSALSVRKKYRENAIAAGIDVRRQDRTDYQQIAYWASNEGNNQLTLSAIRELSDVRRQGVAGLIATVGPLLHALYHLMRNLLPPRVVHD